MATAPTPFNPADMIACPACDLLHRRPVLAVGGRARCLRCGTTMLTRKPRSIDRALAATIGALVLYLAAVTLPFLALSRSGLESQISVVDSAMALWTNDMHLLAVIAFAFILIFPLMRLTLLISILIPLRLNRRLPSWGRMAFRWVSWLQPWDMMEIFMIGVIVSLVKIIELADISVGPAFWALSALVIVTGFIGAGLCRETIWAAMDQSKG